MFQVTSVDDSECMHDGSVDQSFSQLNPLKKDNLILFRHRHKSTLKSSDH